MHWSNKNLAMMCHFFAGLRYILKRKRYNERWTTTKRERQRERERERDKEKDTDKDIDKDKQRQRNWLKIRLQHPKRQYWFWLGYNMCMPSDKTFKIFSFLWHSNTHNTALSVQEYQSVFMSKEYIHYGSEYFWYIPYIGNRCMYVLFRTCDHLV